VSRESEGIICGLIYIKTLVKITMLPLFTNSYNPHSFLVTNTAELNIPR